jgi:tetratricopeptide (TPR) repeat protein
MTWRRSVGIAALAAVGIAAASLAQERFDYQVRDDMFRAFGGNEAAFKNAMSIIDAKLREDPDHAEALVWRGAGRYWKAGQTFGAGDTANARVLADAAMADMDRAIALQPSNIAVLIPRATVLLVAARYQRDPERIRNLATRVAVDFETALAIRQPVFDQLGQHNRGEYLSGLAESWALAGSRDKAENYLRRILVELSNSPYAERAAAKLADWSDRRPLNCQTCH